MGRTITVSDEVWKALDTMGQTSDTFDSVIRRLIKESGKAIYLEQAEETIQSKETDLVTQLGDRIPNNTELRANHKRVEYHAIVKNGYIVIGEKRFKSPSVAAKSITGYNINGWYFWETRDERNGEWISIAALRDYWTNLYEKKERGKSHERTA